MHGLPLAPIPLPPSLRSPRTSKAVVRPRPRAGGETECAVIIQSEVSASQQGTICQGCRRCKEQEKVRKEGRKEGRKQRVLSPFKLQSLPRSYMDAGKGEICE